MTPPKKRATKLKGAGGMGKSAVMGLLERHGRTGTAESAFQSRSNSSSTGRSRQRPARDSTRYVLCVNNNGYPASLDLGRFYRCLRDPSAAQHSMRRIVDESGEDYLYPRD